MSLYPSTTLYPSATLYPEAPPAPPYPTWGFVLHSGPDAEEVADLPVAGTLRFELDGEWAFKFTVPAGEPVIQTFYEALAAGVPRVLAYRFDDGTTTPLKFAGGPAGYDEQAGDDDGGITFEFLAPPAWPLKDRYIDFLETNNGTRVEDGGTLTNWHASVIAYRVAQGNTLLTNPYAESGSGWTGTNGSLARSLWSLGGDEHTFFLTRNGSNPADPMSMRQTGVSVTAGAKYSVTAGIVSVDSAVSQATISVDWYDGSSSLISTDTSPAITVPYSAEVGKVVLQGVTAPPTAETCAVTVSIAGLSINERIVITDINLLLAPTTVDNEMDFKFRVLQAQATRQKSYARKNAWEAIREMTAQQIDDGFDLDVRPLDPSTPNTPVSTPMATVEPVASLGSDKSATVIFEYGPGTGENTLQVTRQWQNPINRVTCTVNHAITGEPVAATVEDIDSISKYGLFEYAEETPDALNNADLTDRAQKLLQPDPIATVTFTPDPAAPNTPQPWRDYWLGDTVGFYARTDYGLNIDATDRVVAIEIDIDDSGNEIAHRVEYGKPKSTIPRVLGRLASRVYWLERSR